MWYFAAIEHVGNDGEMCIGEHHLKLVSIGDTSDHIANGAADGTENGDLLTLLVPHLEDKSAFLSLVILDFAHIKGHVLERPSELAKGALDLYYSGLNFDLDAFRNLQVFLCEDVLHNLWF
jgi:hypothetical protein